MDKLIKFFPLMPGEKDTGKLIGALAFYIFVPGIVATILGFIVGLILGLTIILAILAPVAGGLIGLAGFAYTVMGVVFAIMSYTGHKFE